MIVTEIDKQRLMSAAERTLLTHPGERPHVDELRGILEDAQVVAPSDIASDIVTMNSRVCLEDLESHDRSILTVVYPEDAAPETGRVSVLASLGMAVIGRRPGDEIREAEAGVVRRLKLLKILYQPEAAGNYAL